MAMQTRVVGLGTDAGELALTRGHQAAARSSPSSYMLGVMHKAAPFQILGINDQGVDIKANAVSVEDALRLADEWAASKVQTITSGPVIRPRGVQEVPCRPDLKAGAVLIGMFRNQASDGG